MLTFLGEWFHWLSLSWRRRKKLGRPTTVLELVQESVENSKRDMAAFRVTRDQLLADEAESGGLTLLPWERRRADDE